MLLILLLLSVGLLATAYTTQSDLAPDLQVLAVPSFDGVKIQPCCGPFWGERPFYVASLREAMDTFRKLDVHPVRSTWSENVVELEIKPIARSKRFKVVWRRSKAYFKNVIIVPSFSDALLAESLLVGGYIGATSSGPAVNAYLTQFQKF